MKSLSTLLCLILLDEGQACAIDTSRDINTVTARFGDEGQSFLTLTLPNLASGLERGLALGRVTPDLFPGFRCRQNLPVFMGGFFELIFERVSGMVLDTPSPDAVRAIRQVSLFCKKVELECSPGVTQAAYDKYVECDTEVREWEESVPLSVLTRFQRMGSLLFSGAFTEVDRMVRDYELLPRHGSGATADRLVGNHKFEMPEWTERLEDVFPFWKYASSTRYRTERYDRVHFREPGQERPVKVVSVPKTLSAPRIIAEEPSCMQYVQQGLMLGLREVIESSWLDGFIGTASQLPNQELAREGSITGSLATLDLSEASDRVSNLLVTVLMEHWPHLHDAVQACRSTTADVPGHGVIPLYRFASMGSALTFPVEMMVFLTVVFLGLEDAYHTRFTRIRDILRFLGRVRIYGDDIIVPVDAVDSVRLALTRYGFVVNNTKSFWTGGFRESCGKEYLYGEDVTLVRARQPFPTALTDCEQMISTVSLMNQLYKAGLWRASFWIKDELAKLAPIPVVSESSVVLGFHSFLRNEDGEVAGRYQVPLVKGLVPRYRRRYTPIDGEAALHKTLLAGAHRDRSLGEPVPYSWDRPVSTDRDHLIYSGRPEAVALHLRKAPA